MKCVALPSVPQRVNPFPPCCHLVATLLPSLSSSPQLFLNVLLSTTLFMHCLRSVTKLTVVWCCLLCGQQLRSLGAPWVIDLPNGSCPPIGRISVQAVACLMWGIFVSFFTWSCLDTLLWQTLSGMRAKAAVCCVASVWNHVLRVKAPLNSFSRLFFLWSPAPRHTSQYFSLVNSVHPLPVPSPPGPSPSPPSRNLSTPHIGSSPRPHLNSPDLEALGEKGPAPDFGLPGFSNPLKLS